MTLSDFQEEIAKLFLRLNGYVTSSLIIHSQEQNKNKTEIDLVGVRFPYHLQDDRIVKSSDYLQIPKNTIDIVIGEVKGGDMKNQFNGALWKDQDALQKLVKWIGVLPENRISEVTDWLAGEMATKNVNKLGDFPCLIIDKIYSIRPMIFNLDDSSVRTNKGRFIYGKLMMDYIWECLRPENIRPLCSTKYPINLWGYTLEPIIAYFKDIRKTDPGTVKELYEHFKLF